MRSAISEIAREAIFRWRSVRCAANFFDGAARVGERERGEVGNREAGNFHGEAFGAEAPLVANSARDGRHILREPFAVTIGAGFFQAGFQMADHSLKMQTFLRASIFRIAAQNQVLNFARHFIEGHVEIESIRFRGDSQRAL